MSVNKNTIYLDNLYFLSNMNAKFAMYIDNAVALCR